MLQYNSHHFFRKTLIQSVLILSLVACGGGSDGGEKTAPTPTNKAPTANAGEDQTVDEGNSITLSGSGTDTDGSISSYSWTQTSGESVTIDNSTIGSASFDVTTATQVTLTFQLTVTDNDGATGSDTVNFTINPINAAPVLATIEDKVTYQDTAIEIALTASDSNDDSLTFNTSLLNNASFEVEIADGILHITPINQYFGDEVITVNVSDGELEDSTDFTLQVLQVSIPPIAQIPSDEISTPPPMPVF
ncbi:PKD domain-containing protein [Colwellia sp. BRX8-9]|uniref:PKD domain-containing protein n=1 Tax=Colwellia sp. BRX8-9 TaxID=2759831 RepID=UPI0015F3B761|nr:Ig-like domain-containing protein [Colwellia sp. BRX8-9]MBA6347196.1 hypothetical protein [Colwellia sp. BRX8-9]